MYSVVLVASSVSKVTKVTMYNRRTGDYFSNTSVEPSSSCFFLSRVKFDDTRKPCMSATVNVKVQTKVKNFETEHKARDSTFKTGQRQSR